MQEGKEAQARIASCGIHDEVRVKVSEQQQERSGTILLTFVGGPKVVKENDTEPADEVGELEGQAAIPIA
jgi:hypothetical protein